MVFYKFNRGRLIKKVLRVRILKYISFFFFVSVIITNFLYIICDNFDVPNKYYLYLFWYCFVFQFLTISDIIYINKNAKNNDNIIIKSWKILSLRNKAFIYIYFIIIISTGLFYYLSSKSNPAHQKFIYVAIAIGIFNKIYFSIYSSRQKILTEYKIDDDYKFLKSIIPPKELLLGMIYTFIMLVVLVIILFIYFSK